MGQNALVNALQCIKISGVNTLIDFMNCGIDRPQFHYLSPCRGDKTPIGCTAGGGQLCGQSRDFKDGFPGSLHQFSGLGQKGLATQVPVDVVFELIAVEYLQNPALEVFIGYFRRKAEVEVDSALSGNDIAGALASLGLPDLEAGGGEVLIAFIPYFPGQVGK